MRPPRTLEQIRTRALAATLLPPTTLGRAIAALGFVQADPIRAPARAQDLILRHRVRDYRAGDLERGFGRLALEEDYLYAYGFLPRAAAHLLHPRHDSASPGGRHVPAGLAAEVLAFVAEKRLAHPADLEASFGRERTTNGWGQMSKATTRALHLLQHHGLLRVARRRNGIRLYALPHPRPDPLEPDERARRLVMLVLRLMAPASEAGLGRVFGLLRRGAPGLGPFRAVLAGMLRSGEVESAAIDGETYLWPAGLKAKPPADEPRVRLLAPFDPIVWERRRFEHLWGWDYRLEAYTPPEKRRFGYYALPLLWGDRVIGWANVAMMAGGIDVKTGFAGPVPKDRAFARALDEEAMRLEAFLGADTAAEADIMPETNAHAGGGRD